MIDPPADISSLRLHLLNRIQRRYQTLTRQVSIGQLEFSFTRIADPDIVLDQVAAEEDRRDRLVGRRRDGDVIHLPYWAELWDSAWGIGRYLTDNPGLIASDSQPARVLDLGCGMGMAGTVAAALGARVTFADLEPPALLFAALNSLPWSHRVQTRQLNWQKDTLGRQFDLIIGADILYEKIQWQYLEPFWQNHLAAGGTVLLGEPGRQTGDGFLEWIKPRPWILDEHQQPVPTRPKPIRLLTLRRV